MSRMIERNGCPSSLRAKCIRLMFKASIVQGAASTFLKSANLALRHQVDLRRDMRYLYEQSEKLKEQASSKGGVEFEKESY